MKIYYTFKFLIYYILLGVFRKFGDSYNRWQFIQLGIFLNLEIYPIENILKFGNLFSWGFSQIWEFIQLRILLNLGIYTVECILKFEDLYNR